MIHVFSGVMTSVHSQQYHMLVLDRDSQLMTTKMLTKMLTKDIMTSYRIAVVRHRRHKLRLTQHHQVDRTCTRKYVYLNYYILVCRAIKQSVQGMVKVNTWVFILRRYKWHIHAGSSSLVNCWREGSTLPYKGCS